jgi:PAS domain S-box-containing protein
MKDPSKIIKELITEVSTLKQRIHDLEQSESERQEIDHRLRQHASIYRSLIEYTQDGIYILDPSGYFTFVNDVVVKRSGYPAQWFLSRRYLDIISAEYRERAQIYFSAVMNGSSHTHYELSYVAKSGDSLHVEVCSAPISENGKVTGLLGISRDITERNKFEKALRESEERFRLAISATKEGIWEMDLQTNQGFFSPRWCEIIGYSSDDPALPHTFDAWASRIHPDDYERVISARNRHIEQGTEYDVDYRHRHQSGEYRWQYSRGRMVLDNESGIPIKIVGCISDITERKQTEEALRESEAKYRSLASTLDALVLVDRDCRVLLANDNYRNLHEFKGDAFIGRRFVEFHDSEVSAIFAESVKHVFETGNSYQDERLGSKSGRWWIRTFSPVLNSEGGVALVTVAFKDITNRKLAEEELKKYQKSLEDMVKERTEQLESKNITLHEINTALTVLLKKREEDKKEVEERFVTNIQSLILPYVESLQKSDLDTRQQAQLDIVAAHLREITTPLLRNLRQFNLTSKETAVATLVMQGKTTKEIAAILGVETSSIDDHRHNIRKKLGLSRTVNLHSKLQALK